jgi:hypothetical protein
MMLYRAYIAHTNFGGVQKGLQRWSRNLWGTSATAPSARREQLAKIRSGIGN